ncbi:hypothetical protein D9M73_141660 [compost metagenome]
MKDTDQQDLQAVKPAMAAPTQTAIEKQHFQQVQAEQCCAGQSDQSIEGEFLGNQQIHQHHPPEHYRQGFAQPQ